MNKKHSQLIRKLSKAAYGLGIVFLLVGMVLSYVTQPASAAVASKSNPNCEFYIDVCHQTGNPDHPYEKISVYIYDYYTAISVAGHKDHSQVPWTFGKSDIWPAYQYSDNVTIDAFGPQEWLNTNCIPPTVTPPTETQTVTPPTETQTVTPPTETQTVTPPTETQTVTPPTETQTVTPPTETQTVTPPTETQTVTPPTETQTTTPPTITPPTQTQTLTPPTQTQIPTDPVVTPPTEVPTLLPPQNITPSILIPITGEDMTKPAVIGISITSSQSLFINLGFVFLGLGLVFHGVSKRIDE